MGGKVKVERNGKWTERETREGAENLHSVGFILLCALERIFNNRIC
jgi:hypothetical protein